MKFKILILVLITIFSLTPVMAIAEPENELPVEEGSEEITDANTSQLNDDQLQELQEFENGSGVENVAKIGDKIQSITNDLTEISDKQTELSNEITLKEEELKKAQDALATTVRAQSKRKIPSLIDIFFGDWENLYTMSLYYDKANARFINQIGNVNEKKEKIQSLKNQYDELAIKKQSSLQEQLQLSGLFSKKAKEVSEDLLVNLTGKRKQIITAAVGELGLPYIWGGNDPNTGLDCSGFTQYCYKQAGISIPRTAADQSNYFKGIDISELQPGDLVFFIGTSSGRGGDHVAMYLGENTLIHENGTLCTVTSFYGEITKYGTLDILDQ